MLEWFEKLIRRYINRPCGALAKSSQQQCKKRRIWGSKYCWQHHPWGTNFVALLAGGVVGFLVNVASTKFLEKAPDLSLYINERQVRHDTVIVLPTNAPFEIRPLIHNGGDLSAEDTFVMITVHTLASNLVHGPKWLAESVAGFGTVDPLQEKMVQYADRVLYPKFNLSFQPFWLHQTKVEVFYGFVQYGATGADIKRARLHLVFTNPTGITNVYYDAAARTYLERFGNTVAAHNINQAVLSLRLEDSDSNEIHTVERLGGIIRTNQAPK